MSDERIVSDREGYVISTDGVRHNSEPGIINQPPAGEVGPSTPVDFHGQPVENFDPYRRRVVNPSRPGIVVKVIKRLVRLAAPPKTPEQIAVMEEKDQRKLLTKTLDKDARTAERRMKNRLQKLGICHRYRRRDSGPIVYDLVDFDAVKYEPNAIWFHIDTDGLPFGVDTETLKEKRVIDNLGIACRHAVACEWSVEKGIWYIMERASGAMGIPSRVAWAALYGRMPASADTLTIGIGMATNNRPIFDSLNNMVHVLVAGASGFGKSVFLSNMLCTLILRNTPTQLQIVLIDLKGGNVFQHFKNLPHLLCLPEIAPDGICRDREHVFQLLDACIKEAEHRMKIFADAGATDIGEYNAHRRRNRLSRWVILIDEWADVFMGQNSSRAVDKLVNIAQRCRSVGIHLVVCTQVPKASILDTMITANLPGKVVFHFPTFQGSRAALDNGHANGLKVRGRAVFVSGEEVQVQTPFISTDMIKEIVHSIVSGDALKLDKAHDVTEEEMREWAVRYKAGYLALKELDKEFGARGMARDEVHDIIKSWDGREFLINGGVFRCQPPAGSRGRQLVAVVEADEDLLDDLVEVV